MCPELNEASPASPASPHLQQVLGSALAGGHSSHVLQIYESEVAYAQIVAAHLSTGLSAGHPVLIVATEPHRKAIKAALASSTPKGRAPKFMELDARETLNRFMTPKGPDHARFSKVVSNALNAVSEGSGGLAPFVHGEMVDLLWSDGDAASALELERLWETLLVEREAHLVCTYSAHSFTRAEDAHLFEEVCRNHSHVAPSERFTTADPNTQLREVARLQHRARLLEAEVERRAALELDLRRALAERAHAEAETEDRERELTDCLENAAEAIHWVGPDGVILWANSAELDLLGYSEEEYLGRHIGDFHADCDVINDILKRLTQGETLRGYEARLKHRDGSIRHVLINSNVLWRDGKFLHTRCFTRDITDTRAAALERERLLERERDARREAEAASRAKSQFLAIMSHELRTPLNAIGGYVELLQLGIRGAVTDDQREDLSRIERSQRHLLGLINEVLNYTSIERGVMRYDIGDIDMSEVLASTEALVSPQFTLKGVRFVIEQCAGGTLARADRDKVRQILVNLLSNAAKFTDRGEVRLTCRIETRVGASRVLVHVADTGEGIHPSKLDVIFEPFVQATAGLTRIHEGAGLGLAISRDLARAMHGDLTVKSTQGVGSVFTLALPTPKEPGATDE